MAVMTIPPKQDGNKIQFAGIKKHTKSLEKCRPITATLKHPLILDIKLLQKLDMTIFTKKGLIALSKFCGISLITKATSKRKFNKYMKTIQDTNKQVTKENAGVNVKTKSAESIRNDSLKSAERRRAIKAKIPKIKPRVNFKTADTETSCQEDEDSLDVVCKKPEKLTRLKPKSGRNPNSNQKKPALEEVLNGTVEDVPQPCNSCNRSEQPERFHSHPKDVSGGKEKKLMEKTRQEDPVKTSNTVATSKSSIKPADKGSTKGNNQSAKGASLQKSAMRLPFGLESDAVSPKKFPKAGFKCSTEQKEVGERKTGSEGKQARKSENFSPVERITASVDDLKLTGNAENSNEEVVCKSQVSSPDNALKYVTGCYICGVQVPPKLRMQHEQECILEWRNTNRRLHPDDRRPEPIRPDYRFTASGDLDCQGTFESIWANHKDSLVPCKVCGRTFFPERIEKHEACCNNAALKMRNKR